MPLAPTWAGIARQTLADWRTKRIGPKYLKVGRLVRYRQVDLDAWLEGCVMDPEE